MTSVESSIRIEDDDSDRDVSIIVSNDDETINAMVVCNPDWSSIW